MIRLFKLTFIFVILAGAYFSFKQHNDSLTLWQSVTSQKNVKVKFPGNAKHTKKIRNFPIIGQAKLQIYQLQTEPDLFVYIELQARTKNLTQLKLNELEATILALNGTDDLKITNKHFFDLESKPALDYVAHDKKGNLIYCRTIKINNQLVSMIYASPVEQFSKKRHKQFFNSLTF